MRITHAIDLAQWQSGFRCGLNLGSHGQRQLEIPGMCFQLDGFADLLHFRQPFINHFVEYTRAGDIGNFLHVGMQPLFIEGVEVSSRFPALRGTQTPWARTSI